MKKEDTGKI